MTANYAPLASAPVDNNQGFARLMARVPPRVRETFTREQVEALAWAAASVETRHRMARRHSFRLFGRNYYFALFFGRCRRYRPGPIGRFIARGLEYSWPYRALRYSAIAGAAVAASVGVIAGAYLMKSGLGIDLMDAPSPLHDILYRENESASRPAPEPVVQNGIPTGAEGH